jgi:hypothetical protein
VWGGKALGHYLFDPARLRYPRFFRNNWRR